VTITEGRSETKRAVPNPRHKRREVAPPGNVFWRFVFPVMVIAAAAAVFGLWRAGTKAVLDSADGQLIEVITDPALPGFEAFVDPTPTLLVAHVDNNNLVGITVMARTALDRGGNLVVLSPDMLVPTDTSPGQTAVLLGQAYSSGGIDQIQTLVEGMFGFGFTEVIEADTQTLGSLMQLVEPIPFRLADDLEVRDGSGGVETWLTHGVMELDGQVAAQIYGFRNPGEFDVNRVERQIEMWRAWLAQLSVAPDIQAAALPFEIGLSPYLRAFATGTYDIATPPVDAVQMDPESLPLYVAGDAGDAWIAQKAIDMVPLPISTKLTHRPSVRLLDGTGDPDNRLVVREELVADGAVISILGNASEFGVQNTTVSYHSSELEPEASRIASLLGAELMFVEKPDLPYDITVTVGIDRAGS